MLKDNKVPDTWVEGEALAILRANVQLYDGMIGMAKLTGAPSPFADYEDDIEAVAPEGKSKDYYEGGLTVCAFAMAKAGIESSNPVGLLFFGTFVALSRHLLACIDAEALASDLQAAEKEDLAADAAISRDVVLVETDTGVIGMRAGAAETAETPRRQSKRRTSEA